MFETFILHFIILVEPLFLNSLIIFARKRYTNPVLTISHTGAKANALRVHCPYESARRGGPAASVSVIAFFCYLQLNSDETRTSGRPDSDYTVSSRKSESGRHIDGRSAGKYRLMSVAALRPCVKSR